MKFSFIIPAYNYGHTLARAIDSIFQQPGDDYEAVVVNDGSTDDTATVVGPYLNRFKSRIRYVEQVNQGVSVARNRGIAESRGEYVILLDADDEMMPGGLNAVRDRLGGTGNLGMILGGHYARRASGREKYYRAGPLPPSREQCFLDFLQKKIYANIGAAVIHRDVFQKIQYQPGLGNSEDIVVFAHILANFSCESVDVPLARLHRHAGSLRSDLVAVEHAGLKLVDYLFDPTKIPAALMAHRDSFYYRRCLTLFRKYYKAKRYRPAARHYHLALRGRPLLALRLTYVGKYVRMLIRWR